MKENDGAPPGRGGAPLPKEDFILALQESGEMYLETILILSRQKELVRAVDVGDYMGYSKPSVSRAMGLLRSGGYITVARDGAIRLTPAGRQAAETIYERHALISRWLRGVGVSEKTAAEDACRIEHVISAESFEAVKRWLEARREPEDAE